MESDEIPLDEIPPLIASSVIRASKKGDSHGALYYVNPSKGIKTEVLEWTKQNIDWGGRGGERGLRGLETWDTHLLVADRDQIHAYDSDFERRWTIDHPTLHGLHEISRNGQDLYLTSTSYDTILRYDLGADEFDAGYHLHRPSTRRALQKAGGVIDRYIPPKVRRFDPKEPSDYPPREDYHHINSVQALEDGFRVAGQRMKALIEVRRGKVDRVDSLPLGTHNAIRWKGRLYYNDTENSQVHMEGTDAQEEWSIPEFPDKTVDNISVPDRIARRRFNRGLVPLSSRYVAVGTSPAAVHVFELGTEEPVLSVRISRDVRNAIHGLSIYPFENPP